ncbi:hypothetical protein Gotur_014241 [Gossypium turneri]
MFSKTFAPLEAHLEKDWPKDVTEQHWVSVFQNLRAGDITWRTPWIRPSILLYKFTDGWAQLEFAFKGEGYMKRGSRYCEFLEKNLPNGLALYADTITIDYDI